MTEKELRLEYKRDTGLEALGYFETEMTIPEIDDMTPAKLKEPIEVEILLDTADIPYITWLEEKLCKR